MASLDWSLCPVVESIPGKVSGAWVFKGTSTPVAVVFENLEDGMTIDEVKVSADLGCQHALNEPMSAAVAGADASKRGLVEV